jgi:hypothetical protein
VSRKTTVNRTNWRREIAPFDWVGTGAFVAFAASSGKLSDPAVSGDARASPPRLTDDVVTTERHIHAEAP